MRYYFDHNACTPVDPRVLQCFLETERGVSANPGSLHGSGRKARAVVELARDRCANALGVPTDAVVFVSGGTEANNMVIAGSGNLQFPVLLAPLEHPSALAAAERRGCEFWSVNQEGEALLCDPAEPVGLLCLVHGQNEVGTLQPITKARELATSLAVPLHVDASQTLGRVDLAEALRCADSVTLSTHKAGGLRGMGVLLLLGEEPKPLFVGGAQERGLRPGTESPALAAATALALEIAIQETEQRATAMGKACQAFAATMPSTARKLTPQHALPNTLMYSFAHVDGRTLLPALDMAGVEASQGSACSSGSPTPPRILQAMQLTEQEIRSCVRFSFSQNTGEETARAGGEIVAEVLERCLL